MPFKDRSDAGRGLAKALQYISISNLNHHRICLEDAAPSPPPDQKPERFPLVPPQEPPPAAVVQWRSDFASTFGAPTVELGGLVRGKDFLC